MSVFLKKYFVAALSIFAFLSFLVLKQTDEAPAEQTLIVGLQSGYPPFEFIDAQGKLVGFDLDVAGLISAKLGKTLVIKDMDFDGEILSLNQGKIDLIISGMNITESRLKEIHLVPYYGEAARRLSLIFWDKIPEGVHSLEDIAHLPNPTVSVQTGAVSEIYLSNFKNIQAKSFIGSLIPLMDVKYGKSSANLVEADVAEYLKSQHPEIQVLDIPLTEEDSILGFGIGIKKGNQTLLQQIQGIVQELKTSGQLKKLEDQWFKGGI